ncbi:MAG TPA: hypothetical protein PKA27_12870 [Fimbriimonadaceae bacterium]|nr:hypothetical protein [Fimbriimonadaceae bacterium]
MRGYRPILTSATVVAVGTIFIVSSRSAVSSGQAGALVRLQASSPGVEQSGHSNISGTALAGKVGIGSSGGAFPLTFASTLGDKISLYGATGNHYGFGIQGSLLQIHSDSIAADIAFGYGTSTSFTERMRIKGNGNVGIGTISPTSKLHLSHGISGVGLFVGDLAPFGDAAFETNVGTSRTHLWLAESGNRVASVTGGGAAFFKGSIATDGNANFYKGWLGNSGGSTGAGQLLNVNNNGFVTFTQIAGTNGVAGGIAVGDDGTIQRALMYSNGTQGIVQATVKNFREPNEQDPETDIVYASVEGPEAAAYVRGTGNLVGGRAVITLPDHFQTSCLEDGMTVQLTPMSASSNGLAVIRKGLDSFEVAELQNGTGNYEFDWEVKAVRKGFKNYAPVRPWNEGLLESKMSLAERYKARLKDNERYFRARNARDAEKPDRR